MSKNMNPNVSITTMNVSGRNFVFANVVRSMSQIGFFRHSSNLNTTTDIFFIEKEPILKIINPNINDEFHNKSIEQISGAEKCSDFIQVRLSTACDNVFGYNQGLERTLIPVLELFKPGLYVLHEAQMQPCDGNGGFFWNAYGVKKEINGTSDKNAVIGNSRYSPCFLVPTHQASNFQAKRMYSESDKFKLGKKPGGIAVHISGMFSALLTGHHTATAALANDTDFRCVVIEPVNEVVYDNSKKGKKERRITALSCPYVTIPVEELPAGTLERFLITRKYIKPFDFPEIRTKIGKHLKTVSRKVFPSNVYEKAELLPDCALVESAAGIDSVSEEQLTALLAGESMYDGEYIVSNNYYSSIVAVTNYLQTADFKRFLSFALELLKNDELAAVHKYVAERLLTVMNPAVYEFFASVESSGEDTGIVGEIADKYVKRWKEHSERKAKLDDGYHKKRQKKSNTAQAIAESRGIATLEAAVRNIGDMPRSDNR
ncbi:MAG: hypothetical protein FWG83_01315 [Oscillospiraceae bacterium]|nr:hypothetical protein [Oscillospiraceae bacterium]